jgi:iron complex transport system substrate-binding protein
MGRITMRLRQIIPLPLALALALAMGLALLGCGAQQPDEGTNAGAGNPGAETNAGTGDSAAGFPITIKHAWGETVIESKPERIVALSWSNQDVPLALGVMPVGISEVTYGAADESRMLLWTSQKVKELGGEPPVVFKDSEGFDFEAISDLKPDLILAAQSGVTQEEYELLSEIAPTIAYPGEAWVTTWRDTITLQATAMGMEAEGKQLVTDLETLIADTAAKYPQIKGTSACFVYVEPTDLSVISVYGPTDSRPLFLSDLGLVTPPSVEAMASQTDSFYLDVSAENVDVLSDVGIIVTYGDESLLETLQNDPLLGTIPAIQRGSVILIGDGTALYSGASPSALSIPWCVEEYAKLLGDAAAKIG